MKAQSYSSPSSPTPSFPNQNVIRKHSFIKHTPTKQKPYALELPRFHSSDEKKPKKILSQQKAETKQSQQSKQRGNLHKKQPSKYSKTQKKQTPPKSQSSLKNIQMSQQNSQQSWQQSGDVRLQLQKARIKRQRGIEQLQHFNVQNVAGIKLAANSSINLNKIRYKVNPKQIRRQAALQSKQKKEQVAQTQDFYQIEREQKTDRPEKSSTEIAYIPEKQCHTLDNHIHVSLKKIQMQDQSSHRRKGRGQGKQGVQIGHEQVRFLQLMIDLIRQTIRNPKNLDYPEAYIVCQKAKHEKIVIMKIQQRYQKDYKFHIALSRLTFYLVAHFILISLSCKRISEALKLLLENQLIIMGVIVRIVQMVGVGQKMQSLPKSIISEGVRRQRDTGLAIENRGGNICKNNDTIKAILEQILSKNRIVYAEIFQSLMVSASEIDSFEFIAFLDKTLKWQVLKMPSYPFLPACITNQSHYLILDLDQTLIHFDSNKDIFHIRPHTEQFLKNLSKFYEISIFTAGTKDYADEIINEIDRGGYVKHRLYRNHLTYLAGQSVKDLTMLGRSMKTTLIIDNLQSNFRMHAQNGILIKSWFRDDSDQVLIKLQSLLIKIVKQFGQDLRKGVKAYQAYIDREITGRIDRAFKVKYKI